VLAGISAAVVLGLDGTADEAIALAALVLQLIDMTSEPL
jgi:hypothetical protein